MEQPSAAVNAPVELPIDVLGLIVNMIPSRSLLRLSLSNKQIRSQIFNYVREFDSNDDMAAPLLHPISGKSLGLKGDNAFIGETHAENASILPFVNGLHTLRVCVHEIQDLHRVADAIWRNRFCLKTLDLDLDKISKMISSSSTEETAHAVEDDDAPPVKLIADYLSVLNSDEEEDESDDDDQESEEAASGDAEKPEGAAQPSLVLLCHLMQQAGFNRSNGAICKAQSIRLRRSGMLPSSQLRLFLQFFPDLLDLSLDCVISQAGLNSIPELCPKIVSLATDLVDGAKVEPLEQAKFLKKLTLGGIGSLLMTAATIPAALDVNHNGDGPEASFPLSMMRQIAVYGPPSLGYNVGVRLSFDEEESVRTVLQIVISASDVRTVEFMLRAGADPNNELYLEQSQKSALFHAFQLYSRTNSALFLRVLHKLLDFGANIFAPCQPGSVSFIHHLVNRGDLDLLRSCLFEKRKIYRKKPGSMFRPRNQPSGHSFPKDNMLGFVSALLNVVAGAATLAREGNAVQDSELCEFDELYLTPYEYSKSLYESDEAFRQHALPQDGLTLVHAAASWLPEAPSNDLTASMLQNKMILLNWLIHGRIDEFGGSPASELFSREFIGTIHSLSSKLRTPMHACGHPDIIKYLVAQGADPRGDPNLSALLPIHAAAFYGKLSTVQQLLDVSPGGADINSALLWAIRGGRHEAVSHLFGLGAQLPEDNMIELHDTIRAYSSCVLLAALVSSSTRLLPEDGPSIRRAFFLIWESPCCSDEEKVALISESFGGSTEYGSLFAEPLNGVFVALLKKAGPIIVQKANVRTKGLCGLTLLLSAVGAKSVSRVQTLLDICPELVNECDKMGQSPLHYAAAPPGIVVNFETFVASTTDIVNALVDAGVDVLAKTSEGRTALDLVGEAPPEISEIFTRIHTKARKEQTAKARAAKKAATQNSNKNDEESGKAKVLPDRKAKSKKRKTEALEPDEAAAANEPAPKYSSANSNQDTKDTKKQEDEAPTLRRSKRRKLE